jgi:hypothetical protein
MHRQHHNGDTSHSSDALAGIADRPLSDWRCRLACDRPIYDCPECHNSGMQYFVRRLDMPGREDFFYCCACGTMREI